MDSKIPVVMAHGNTESGAHWRVVMERLKKAGFTQLFAIDFSPPANGSCVAYAEQLRDFMDKQVLPNIGAHKKVAILAHSLGVTTTRYYIKSLGGKEHVSHAVLIAGANQGIVAADNVLLVDPEGKIYKQAPELHTGNSAFLRQLNSPGGDEGVQFMTLSSPHDFYYSMNEDSCSVMGADNRILPHKGHWAIRDSEESGQLIVAFLEGKVATESLGKALYAYPDKPFGEWHYCLDSSKVQKYTFLEDGTVIFHDGTTEKRGNYKVSSNLKPAWIDITFPEGTYYGFYRLNANGDGLALKLSAVNGIRPADFRYMELYYRTPKEADTPPELLGRWKAIDFSYLKPFVTTEYALTFTADRHFKMEGKMIIAPSFTVEGRYAIENTPRGLKAHLQIEKSDLAIMSPKNYVGCLLEVKDSKLYLTFPPASRGAGIPQVLDYPVVCEKAA